MGSFRTAGGLGGAAQRRAYGGGRKTTSVSGGGGGSGGVTAEYQAAKVANEQRYEQAMSIYDEIVNRYKTGGAFEKASLGQLETQKEQETGKEMQHMISSGLYGTTAASGIGQKWEANVGAPARLRLEDVMTQRLTQAQLGKAGFIERREDVYPDVGSIGQYEYQAAQGGGGGVVSGGTDISSYQQRFNESRLPTPYTTKKPGAGYYGDY